MNQFLTILLFTFGIFGISFLMLNIRHIFTGKEFRGTCSSNNPMLTNEIGECGLCGKKPEENCKMPEPAKS